jgi:hypothetical protein
MSSGPLTARELIEHTGAALGRDVTPLAFETLPVGEHYVQIFVYDARLPDDNPYSRGADLRWVVYVDGNPDTASGGSVT